MSSVFKLIIGPRCDLNVAKSKYGCDTVISIFESSEVGSGGDPTPVDIDKTKHFRFFFDDVGKKHVNETWGSAPTEADIKNIISVGPNLSGRVYIHCYAGISRSTASAYALYCQMLGDGEEEGAMVLTERSAPYGGIWPNDLIVDHADRILNRDGKMIKSYESWKKVQLDKLDDLRLEIEGKNC